MTNHINKKRIKYIIWMWLLLTALGITLPFPIQSVFNLDYEPIVISVIFLILFSIPNLILFLEYYIHLRKQNSYILNPKEIKINGETITLEQIDHVEYITAYTGYKSLALFDFAFYFIHLKNNEIIAISNLSFDHKNPPLGSPNSRAIYYPSIALTSSKHPEQLEPKYEEPIKSVSFFLDKYSKKSKIELQAIIDKEEIFQKEAVEAAKQLIKNSN